MAKYKYKKEKKATREKTQTELRQVYVLCGGKEELARTFDTRPFLLRSK